MFTTKITKEVNTAFVLGELDKVKRRVEQIEDSLEFLYAAVLYVEVKKFVSRHTIVSMTIIQKRFNIGFGRTGFLLQMLFRDRLIRKGDDFENSRNYKVVAHDENPSKHKRIASKAKQ